MGVSAAPASAPASAAAPAAAVVVVVLPLASSCPRCRTGFDVPEELNWLNRFVLTVYS
jgi:hypothetical protein